MLVKLPSGRWVEAKRVKDIEVTGNGGGVCVRVKVSAGDADRRGGMTKDEALRIASDLGERVNDARSASNRPSTPNDFEILADESPLGLADRVRARLREGWKLHGVVIAKGGRFHQAMTRVASPAPRPETPASGGRCESQPLPENPLLRIAAAADIPPQGNNPGEPTPCP